MISRFLGRLLAPLDCALYLTDLSPRDGCDPPTCWTPSGNYYARISPGTYKGAYDFQLDVQKYWAYRNSALNNVTFPIAEGSGGFACSRGGQSTICQIRGVEGFNSTYVTTYGIGPPSPVC